MGSGISLGRLVTRTASLLAAIAVVSAVMLPAPAFASIGKGTSASELVVMQAEADLQVALAQRDTAIIVAVIVGGALIIAALIVSRSKRKQ